MKKRVSSVEQQPTTTPATDGSQPAVLEEEIKVNESFDGHFDHFEDFGTNALADSVNDTVDQGEAVPAAPSATNVFTPDF